MAKPFWNMKQIINQLDADVQWPQPIVTYQHDGFERTNPHDAYVSGLITPLSLHHKMMVELASKTWDDLIPITFRHERNNADISFNHTNRDTAGSLASALPSPTAGISPGTVVPTDPLLAQQWHLIQTVAGRFDLNVRGAWDPAMGKAYTGAGVRVVVVDDGFDYNHADLAAPYNESLDWDYRDNDNDPFGIAFDSEPDPDLNTENNHGTACLGIIGDRTASSSTQARLGPVSPISR